jgi:hypothetical protein
MLDPIHLLLDGLPQHRIVDHLKDKQRFRNLSKRLQRPIEGVLLRVRVEPPEQVRSRHFLELDGRGRVDGEPRSLPCEGEPERMRFASRADSFGRTNQDDSERSPGRESK